jgi:hypothetical protein
MRKQRTSLRILALIIAVASLLATVAFAGTEPQAERKVPVQFNSKPEHAELYIDGKFVGTTDVPLRLAAGEHVIEMKRDNYETWRRELWVSSDNPTRVTGLLKPVR